jgi:hypothetical protein
VSIALYRARLRACPACRSPMRQIALRSMRERGSVDLCDRCGGVYLEFFDGEPAELAREVTPYLLHEHTPRRPWGDGQPIACPDCERVMEVQPYLDDGPHVARCHRCLAVFATPEQVLALARFHTIQDAPPWYARLLATLRSMFTAP